MLRIDFLGNGFLYNMVRILTGTMLEYASHNIDEEKIKNVFTNPIRENAGITAPAKGLFLENVFYTEDELKERLRELKTGNQNFIDS